MSEDVIKVEVDDTELDLTIAKLKQAQTMSTQAFNTTNLVKGSKITGQELKELKTELAVISELNLKDLPSINREMRLLLGQLPGMRQAIWAYFRLKRLARGFELGGWQLYVTLLASALILIKSIMSYQRKMEQNQRNYEFFLMRERGWTREEMRANYSRVHNYMRSMPG